jgi:arylamine N-acetyltransferase
VINDDSNSIEDCESMKDRSSDEEIEETHPKRCSKQPIGDFIPTRSYVRSHGNSSMNHHILHAGEEPPLIMK